MASISRNPNGSYKIRVFCGENKEGNQIVRTKTYTPSDPNLSYAKLTKEVQEAADAFEKEIRVASPRALENITVKQFAKKYLEVKETQLSPTTMRTTRSARMGAPEASSAVRSSGTPRSCGRC